VDGEGGESKNREVRRGTMDKKKKERKSYPSKRAATMKDNSSLSFSLVLYLPGRCSGGASGSARGGPHRGEGEGRRQSFELAMGRERKRERGNEVSLLLFCSFAFFFVF
jgi:hypothetical protein